MPSVLLIFGLFGCASSPLGRQQLLLVPEGQMNSMGETSFEEMKKKQPIEKDPKANAYVACVSRALIDANETGVDPGAWEIVVFKDKTANAFALPGGKIGVHTGMLKVAKNAAQLAAVIGHEIGHVMAKHGNERVSQSFAAQGGLAAISAALNPKDTKHNVLLAALGIGAQVGLLKYSREQESEADDIGLRFMAQAGFDPNEAVNLWKNMSEASAGQPPEFLSSHPSHETRIENLQKQGPEQFGVYESARSNGRKPNCVL